MREMLTKNAVIPFGRITSLRADIAQAGEEGGKAKEFWDWSEEQVAKYL
jgi:retinol dehydrogenase-12